MYFKLFLLCAGLNFCACVSSSRYHSATAERDQLSLQLQENRLSKDSLELIAKELETTKLQLQKTENVLIEFYLKYNQGSEKLDTSTSSNQLENEQTHSTIQESQVLEMKQLNDQLIKSKLDYEQLNAKYEKLIQSKEPKKSTAKKLDSLNKEIVSLKNAVAKERANLVIQEKKIIASNVLMDSLRSQIQFGELRIKQLQYELSELKQETEALKTTTGFDQKIKETELQTEINQLKAGLDELNRLNAQMLEAIQLKDREIEKHKESNAALKIAHEQAQLALTNSKEKETIGRTETEYKTLQEALNQNERTIAALNEIVDEKNLQIQNQKKTLSEQDEKLKIATEQLGNISTSSLKLAQSDSLSKLQEGRMTILEEKNQELVRKITSIEQENNRLEQQLKQLNSELEPFKRLKDSLQRQHNELLQLKKSYTEELQIANSRLKNKQDSLDSLNVKIKALQNSNKQVEIQAKDETIAGKKQKEAAPQVEDKNSNRLEPAVDSKTVQETIPATNKKRINEMVKKQIRTLINSYPIIEFETGPNVDQDLLLIPWDALFDNGSFAIKDSGASLMEAFSSILKQHKKLRISFQKEQLNQTSLTRSDKRINTLKKLIQVYGVSAIQFSEGSEILNANPKYTNTDRIVIFVYID